MKFIKFSSFIFLTTLTSLSLANTFKTEHWLTANGVKVVFYQAMEVPMLDISLAFAAGSAYDEQHYGLAALTTQMMNEGSAGIDAITLAESLADTGAQFDTAITRDMAVFNLRTLTDKKALEQAIATFTQIINQPHFPQAALEREKKQFLVAITQMQASPDELATQTFFQNLYQNHPYAHPVNGTEQSIQHITQQQVIQFYKRYYVAKNATLVIVGAINSPKAHQLAEQLTKKLSPGKEAPTIPSATPLKKAQHIQIPFPSTQTTVRLGQLGIDHQNPNYFPLIVGNYILGGGSLVSRLAIEVREKKGLTYNIDSQFVPMPGPGPFFIALSTQNKEAHEAIHLTNELLKEFVAQGPSEHELKAAKNYLTGSFPMSLASNRTIASLLLRMNFYRLPKDYLTTYLAKINQVTKEDIKNAFEKEIHPEQLLLVTVGQP